MLEVLCRDLVWSSLRGGQGMFYRLRVGNLKSDQLQKEKETRRREQGEVQLETWQWAVSGGS